MSSTAIFSLLDLRQLEHHAQAAGLDLMEQAGQAIEDWVLRHITLGARLLVVAGPGNNGGDALNAARRLIASGFLVDIVLPQTIRSPLSQRQHDRLSADAIPLLQTLPNVNPGWSLIIDGLFGIGLKHDLDIKWTTFIEQLNQLNVTILSLDTPSGLDPWTGTPVNTCIRAHYTLTFLCYKPGLFMGEGVDLAGHIELAQLNCFPLSAPKAEGELNTDTTIAHSLRRKCDSHKGTYGAVIIEGGAPGMTGAALLAGRAALSVGAGKVQVKLLSDGLMIDPLYPELMVCTQPNDTYQTGAVLAIGPGLGQSDRAAERLTQALASSHPLIIDADALNLIALFPSLATPLAQRPCMTVMTPHPTEAARLLETDTRTVQRARLSAARKLAQKFNAIVVLKGAGTLIVRPDGYFRINVSGNPALATAGQGDVLTGLIAGLWAQKLTAFDAASLAVNIHGLASDTYVETAQGPIGLTASETIRRVSDELNPLLSQKLTVDHTIK